MKKILILSDTHGDTDRSAALVRSISGIGAVIHAGDCVRDAEDLSYMFDNIPVYFVAGNNDFFSRAPEHMTVIIDGVRVFIAHGHGHRVKYESDVRTLKSAAADAGAALAVFGHTHIPYCEDTGRIVVVNPGSITYSSTYAIAQIENGKVSAKIFEYK